MKGKIIYAIFIVIISTLAFFIYRQWGLKGSAFLLCFFVLTMFASQRFYNTSEKKLAEQIDQMTPEQLITGLQHLAPKDRDEIIFYMRKNQEKYADILNAIPDLN